jgi:hypothetical protein
MVGMVPSSCSFPGGRKGGGEVDMQRCFSTDKRRVKMGQGVSQDIDGGGIS